MDSETVSETGADSDSDSEDSVSTAGAGATRPFLSKVLGARVNAPRSVFGFFATGAFAFATGTAASSSSSLSSKAATTVRFVGGVAR